MGYTLLISKDVRKVLYKFKNRICTTITSHVNRNESNNLNISNGDNVIGMSKFPHKKFKISVHLMHSLLYKKYLGIESLMITLLRLLPFRQ